jgi:ATP/maltotriose-dependent transcriptional regulator MalT
MPHFLRVLRSWFRRSGHPRQPAPDDADLERFFTDAEEARTRFEQLLGSAQLPRRLVVVHGIGAVGKSSLLKMYRLRCRRGDVPVALVGGEEAPSVVDLLGRWAADLAGDGLALPSLQRSLRRYRGVQAKVEMEARKAGQGQDGVADELAKAAAKGLIQVAASFVPGGALIGAVGTEAAAAVLNLLRAKLDKAEFQLFLDPAKPLTDDFLADLAQAARSRRVVVMLDTFEQVTALHEWVREAVRRMPENVLVVVAGRELPSWDSAWPGWIARTEIIELTEMSDANVEHLVHRYYALFDRGEPDPGRVREVVAFARGLPMAATTVVRLWAAYQQSDLHPVSTAVVADLADRLLQGVPADMRPAFEAAAVLRTFNAESLGALLGGAGVEALHDEIRRWPFTRSRREGLAIHDTMREVMNDAFLARSPAQFRAMNQKAADHYRGQVERQGGEEREWLRLEWLYHSIRVDEARGLRLFCDLAEELVRYQLISRLRTLLSDANTYPLEHENSRLWRRYYGARLEHLEGRTAAAEAVYREIGEDDEAEARLRAYALCDVGANLAVMDRLAEPDGELRALEVTRRSLELQPELDAKLVANYMTLMHLSNVRGDWDESLEHIDAMRAFAESTQDAFGLVLTDRLQAGIRGLRGDWPGSLAARRRYMAALDRLGDVPALRMHASYLTWPLMFMGRYREAQRSGEEALALAVRLEEKEVMTAIIESIALALGLQERYAEAGQRFTEAMNFYENFYAERGAAGTGASERYIRATLSFRGLVSLRQDRLDEAEADLKRALTIKRRIGDRMGIPEVQDWLGELAERRGAWSEAEAAYQATLDLKDANRHYFECWALTGLARVQAAQGRYEACADSVAQAEELGRRFEYNDHLAALRLTQAQLGWEAGEAGEAAEGRYRQALVHALRFNRFLLDEVLAGRADGTVLQPVVAQCLARGQPGRRVLESLGEWWRTGTNQLDDGRPETVSPIEVGVPLLEAERTARQREPGPGLPQRSVIEQIEAALGV